MVPVDIILFLNICPTPSLAVLLPLGCNNLNLELLHLASLSQYQTILGKTLLEMKQFLKKSLMRIHHEHFSFHRL